MSLLWEVLVNFVTWCVIDAWSSIKMCAAPSLLCGSSCNTFTSSLCMGSSVNHSVRVSRSPCATWVTLCVLLSSARKVTCHQISHRVTCLMTEQLVG